MRKNTKYPNKNEFKLNYKNDPKILNKIHFQTLIQKIH